jgi:hypothetical protein
MKDFLVDLTLQLGATVVCAAELIGAVAFATWLTPVTPAFF